MNNKNIWGTYCVCGNELFEYVDSHPWDDEAEFKTIIKCEKCGRTTIVNREIAEEYYNNKIYGCFSSVKGNVIEIGCGGGFLTDFICNKENVDSILAIDIDDELEKENNKIKFVKMDLNDINESIFDKKYDYLICRDVLMYLDDLEKVISVLSKVSSKVCLLNWYNENHRNCINKTRPEDVFGIVKKYYKNVVIEYPSFYKCGYFIYNK